MCFGGYFAREGGGILSEGHGIYLGPARVTQRLNFFDTSRVISDGRIVSEYGFANTLAGLLACFEDVLRELMPAPEPSPATRRAHPPGVDISQWRDLLEEAEQTIPQGIRASALSIPTRTFDNCNNYNSTTRLPDARSVWHTISVLFGSPHAIAVHDNTVVAGTRTSLRHQGLNREEDIELRPETAMSVAGFDRAVLRAIGRQMRLAREESTSLDYKPNDFAVGERIVSSPRHFYDLRATRGGQQVWLIREVPPFVVETASKHLYQFPSTVIGVLFDPQHPFVMPDPVCLSPEFRHPFVNYIAGLAGGRSICVEGLAHHINREADVIGPRRAILAVDIAAAGLLTAAHDSHGYSRLDELEPLRSLASRDPNALFVPWTPNYEVLDAYTYDLPW